MEKIQWLKEKYLHRAFDIGIILKGIHAVIEVVSGFAVLFISHQYIIGLIQSLTLEELTEDPGDIIINYIIHSLSNFTVGSQYFIAIYLLSHGIIKGALVIALLKEKIWSYPIAIVVFSLFGIYQMIEYFRNHSIWLVIFTIMDIFIIYLTLHEYRFMKRTGIKPKWDMEDIEPVEKI